MDEIFGLQVAFFGLQVAFFGVGLACLISMAYAIRLPAMFDLAFLTCRLHVHVGLAGLTYLVHSIQFQLCRRPGSFSWHFWPSGGMF